MFDKPPAFNIPDATNEERLPTIDEMNYHGLKPDGFNFIIQVGLVRCLPDLGVRCIDGRSLR